MLGFALLTGVLGARRGFLGTALSAIGVVVGALLGARLAPHLLSDGASSPYTPLVALLGAGAFAVLFEAAGATVGGRLRGALRFRPLQGADSVAGFVLGTAIGFVLVWVFGAVALQFPGQTRLRQEAQRSEVLQRLNEIAPPSRALRALARVDPFPTIVGPLAPVEPPNPASSARGRGQDRSSERRPRPRNGVRACGLRLRLGRGSRARGHECPRRGRPGRHDGRGSRFPVVSTPRRSRSIPPTTSRFSGCAG